MGACLLQVVEVFQGSFLNRLVSALKKEMKKLSAGDAFSSISVAKLGGEEGFGTAHGSAGDGEAETAAPRKSEKVRLPAKMEPACQDGAF